MSLRKLSSLGLAVALTYSIPAQAEILKNFKTDGSIETKSFGIDNETDRNGRVDDYRSETRTRVMAGGVFDLLEDVHARVLLRKNNRLHGNSEESLNTVQSAVAVDNAWAKIDKVFGKMDLTVGRQFIGTAEDLVMYFGPQNDDILSVSAIDAFRADLGFGDVGRLAGLNVMGIFGKTTESTTPSATVTPPLPNNVNSDTDVFGTQVSFDAAPIGSVAGYYLTRKIKGAGVTANDTLNVLGGRLQGDILAGLGYRAEYIQNFGRNNAPANAPAYHGNAYFANLHYGRDFDGRPFRAHIEYGRGSQDFRAIAPGKRFGLIFGQHTSQGEAPSFVSGSRVQALGLQNLNVFDGGIGINPIAKLGVDFNAYRFMLDAANAAGNRSMGTEYDLILSWKHSDNVSLEANAATFQVGDALQNAAGTATNPVTRIGADIKVKF